MNCLINDPIGHLPLFFVAFALGLAVGLSWWAYAAVTDDRCERCGEDDAPAPETRARMLAHGGSIDHPRGKQ